MKKTAKPYHVTGGTFSHLPSTSVLTGKGRRIFLLNILKNIIFILWDTLSQVKVQFPLNLIQYMKYCGVGENDTVRQYKC